MKILYSNIYRTNSSKKRTSTREPKGEWRCPSFQLLQHTRADSARNHASAHMERCATDATFCNVSSVLLDFLSIPTAQHPHSSVRASCFVLRTKTKPPFAQRNPSSASKSRFLPLNRYFF